MRFFKKIPCFLFYAKFGCLFISLSICFSFRIPARTSPNLRDLLLKMLIRKPADRIDFRTLSNFCLYYYFIYANSDYNFVRLSISASFLSHPFLTTKRISPSGELFFTCDCNAIYEELVYHSRVLFVLYKT